MPAADFVVIGEGEETLPELLAGLEAAQAGRRVAPETVAGLCWRVEGGGTRRSAPRAPCHDLDLLPDPQRDGLVWADGIHPALYQGLVTARGCPYSCLFCASAAVGGRRVRTRSPALVIGEVRRLRARYRVPGLFFHDSVFTLHRGRTLDLCRRLGAEPEILPFQCQTRVDRVDPELLEAMAAAGCTHVLLGIESGDEETLARIGKGVSLPAVRAAVSAVKAAGLRCTGFFMVGFPWETEAHVRRTVHVACDLGLDAIDLFSATPLPGAALWDLVGRAATPASTDFRTPAVNLTGLIDEAYRALYTEVRKQVLRYNAGRIERGG